MFENLFDHIRILNERGHSHLTIAFMTYEMIYLPPKDGGQAPIFWIRRAQFRRKALSVSSGSRMHGISPLFVAGRHS
jgi:hypothetical protein